MNRYFVLRLALHLAVVAVALALGLAVRAMLPSVDSEASRSRTAARSAAATAQEVPPLPGDVSTVALTARGPASLDGFRARIRNLSRHANPVQEQLMLRAELLAGIGGLEDFRIALELIETSAADPLFHQEMITALAVRLGEIDPALASDGTGLIRDRNLRSMALHRVMDAWARRDPEAALTFLRARDTNVKSTALNAVFAELARRDPAAAVTRIREFDEPGFNFGLERTVLSEWWVKDPEAALAWVQGHEPALRAANIRALLEVAGSRDPGGAWKVLQTLPAADRPAGFDLHSLLYTWGHRDPDAALAAVLAEPDAARRGEVVGQLGRAMKMVTESAGGSGNTGVAMLAKVTDPSAREHFILGLAEGYLSDGRSRDYRQAVDLAGQLTDATRRLDLIKSIGSSWARDDAPSASEWLNTLIPGAERDAAIGEFVRGTFATDPAAALTWSASIADEGKRGRRLTELYPKWEKADATAAAAWLERQSEEVRAAVESAASR